MKRTISLIIGLLFLAAGVAQADQAAGKRVYGQGGNINIQEIQNHYSSTTDSNPTIAPWARTAWQQVLQTTWPVGYPDAHLNGSKTLSRYEAAIAIGRFINTRTDNDFKQTNANPINDYFLDQFSPSAILAVSWNHDWTFYDIPTDIWGLEEVNALAHLGILSGYPEFIYRGGKAMTRAEFAMILSRLLRRLHHQPHLDLEQAHFNDVTGDEWWFGAQLVATGTGIMTGFPDHTFRGSQAVTHNEFVVALARIMKLE